MVDRAVRGYGHNGSPQCSLGLMQPGQGRLLGSGHFLRAGRRLPTLTSRNIVREWPNCHATVRAGQSDGPGWRWQPDSKRFDEESPWSLQRLFDRNAPRQPVFLRGWLSEEDPGLNQSLISSGTTISQLFNQDKWENHRSINRYRTHLMCFPRSTVLRRVRYPCLTVAAAGLAVCLWNTFGASFIASKLGLAAERLVISASTVPHTLLGAAISLLLVFRTNSSNHRFAEGRQLWGRGVAASRKWSTLAASYLPAESHELAGKEVKIWATVLKSHLRSGRTRENPNDITTYKDDPASYIRSELPPEQADFVLAQRNLPLAMLAGMTAHVAKHAKAGNINITTQASMQEVIDEMGIVGGGCERILSTPLPLSYTRHTSRSLMFWLLSLPMALWAPCGFSMVPALLLITFVLIGIDELASQIEEPFSILPLTPLVNIIKRETDEVFEMQKRLDDMSEEEGQEEQENSCPGLPEVKNNNNNSAQAPPPHAA